MASIKYQSRTQERGENETIYTLVYQGKREAMEALQEEYQIGSRDGRGELVSNRLYQGDGPIWCVELKWRASWDGDSVEPPAKAWGREKRDAAGEHAVHAAGVEGWVSHVLEPLSCRCARR